MGIPNITGTPQADITNHPSRERWVWFDVNAYIIYTTAAVYRLAQCYLRKVKVVP